MSTIDIIETINSLQEWETILEEAKAEVESLKDTLKREMDTRGIEELEAGTHIVRYTTILSNRMINADLFNGELQPVTITVQSTPRAFGHIVLGDAWSIKGEGSMELNLGAGTLDRPIEEVVATLVHECCHLLNFQNNIGDCSNHGVYHNKFFKASAEAHGLIVTRSEKYGWSHTAPGDDLLIWCLENDIPDIMMNRNEYHGIRIAGGEKSANGGAHPTRTTKVDSPSELLRPSISCAATA